jgi:hypothetical protein
VSLTKVHWLGGPADGGFMLVNDERLAEQIKVITGTHRKPEERYVTPRLVGEKWFLPFYEGQIIQETR